MFLDYLFRVSDRTWKIIIISQSIWLIIFRYTFPISSPEIARKKLIKILSIYIYSLLAIITACILYNRYIASPNRRKKKRKNCHHTWPSTHDGHFVRSRKYRTTYTWPRTNFRVWPGSRLDKMAPRNPCWRRYIHRSTWSGCSYSSSWSRARLHVDEKNRERVCGGTYTRVLAGRRRGDVAYLKYTRDTLLYLALARHVCRWHRDRLG